MATILDYALMAGVAYRDTRAEINRFPIPKEWHLVSRNPQDESTGFEASAFGNAETIFGCTEIVISYAGTDSDDWTGDVAADLALVAGLASEQLLQAAEYYLQIKAINPDAKITLTGHSLGGGLAALVAVFFNETAVTFDQAPFRNAASWMRAKEVLLDLWGKFPVSSYPRITEWLAPLDRFIASFDPLGLGWSQDGLSAREAKVSNTSVQGEIASISNSIRIGTEEPSLQHGDYPHPIDLHTQSLLTAFLQSDATAEDGKALNDVTFKLIDLLKMIFDENLYAVDDLKKAKENFLERLVKHEAGITGSLPADAMLTRFTRDLWKLAQDGGLTLRDGNPTNADLNEVSKALTAFAMQKYYEETADSTG
ncbi:MAG: DUF2974 domain-containing protein, partial [Actinobacteria bacterium]|nr:DUF2974 domain-containing protein [Rhodocyclaceae bacterium]MBU3995885.1 DUF2974 domain-containing protein [Actinomycetota bacterium]MBU4038037.1 DUF2974 domain-containing protein [Pseudomonadota bacterium]